MTDEDAALRALAHPVRRRLLRLAWEDERTSGELARRAGLSRPAASQHLRTLRDARLVTVRVDANRRWYRAHHRRLSELRQMIDDFWERRLDALREAAEREVSDGG